MCGRKMRERKKRSEPVTTEGELLYRTLAVDFAFGIGEILLIGGGFAGSILSSASIRHAPGVYEIVDFDFLHFFLVFGVCLFAAFLTAGTAKLLLCVLDVLGETHFYAKTAARLLCTRETEEKPENLSLDNPARLLYNTKAVKKKALQRGAGDAAPGLETTMAKDLHITFLLDFYGDMLTDKQREVVECYYNEDLSLAEIAEVKGITRQGVRDAIKRAELQLLEMEERLGLAKRFHKVQEELTSICDRALQIEAQNEKNGGDPVIRQNVEAILASAKELVD